MQQFKDIFGKYWLFLLGAPIVYRLYVILLYNLHFWFALDDAYIYLQFAKNFAMGHFLTYSIGEPYSNGCTSFVYYLLYTMCYVTTNSLFGVQALLFAIFVIIYASSVYLTYKILRTLLKEKHENILKFITLVVFTANPIFYGFFSGLEYPLSVFFLLLLVYSILHKKYYLFLSSIILMNLGRPEGVITAFLILLVVSLNQKTFSRNRKYFSWAVYLFSALIVPAINLLYTGILTINSTSRVPIFAIFDPISLIKSDFSIFYDFITPYSNIPHLCSDRSQLFLIFIASIICVILTIIPFIIYIFKKINKNDKNIFSNLWNIKKIIIEHQFILILLLIILSQLSIPLLVGISAEWCRYITPAYPIFAILYVIVCKKIGLNTKHIAVIFLLFLVVNISVVPHWNDEYLKYTNILNSEFYQMGEFLSKNVQKDQIVALDQAGILALMNPGITIDTYGLGTARYAKRPRTNEHVIQLMYKDKPDYCITYYYNYTGFGSPSYYLRSLPYGAKAELLFVSELNKSLPHYPDFPATLEIYRITYVGNSSGVHPTAKSKCLKLHV